MDSNVGMETLYSDIFSVGFLSPRHIAEWYHDWFLLHCNLLYTSHPVI